MPKKTDDARRVFASNRAARYNYTIIDQMEAGLSLLGAEVKSVREGKVVLKDAFATIKEGEVFLHNMHISPYKFATGVALEPERTRKLLLHRREIQKLERGMRQQGFTLVPLRLYLNHGVIKCELGLAKGKRQYDKRASKREDAMKRDLRADLARRQKGH